MMKKQSKADVSCCCSTIILTMAQSQGLHSLSTIM
jgi:hypothetical protein